VEAVLSDPATILSPRRAIVALAPGLLAGSVVALVGEPALAPIVAWTVATLAILTWIWWMLWPQEADATKRFAEAEGQSRSTDTAVLTAAVVSLGAVILALVRSGDGGDAVAKASVVLSVLSAVLSWCLVNTVFALKYARVYYVDEDGGIDFQDPEPPAYCDFAYLAFTVGMSYAVSETAPVTRPARKVVLAHALLSYFFATAVVASAINLVSNLGQS
jgi:uncharacterized membrane protein